MLQRSRRTSDIGDGFLLAAPLADRITSGELARPEGEGSLHTVSKERAKNYSLFAQSQCT
jgi:hypothetical protein